jgi:hypothetical protein
MIENIDNKPIAIICGPRTGSTVLSDYLARQYDLTNFEEAYSSLSGAQVAVDLSTNPRFLFNVKYPQINQSNVDDIMRLYNQSFRIRLRRRDVVKQIASLYLILVRQISDYKTHQSLDVYDISINEQKLLWCVNSVKKCNHGLDTWPHPVDADIFYEDLKFDNTSFQIYHKPTNYDLLLDRVQKLI